MARTTFKGLCGQIHSCVWGILGAGAELIEALSALSPEENSVSSWALWELVYASHCFQSLLWGGCLGISQPLVLLPTHLLVQGALPSTWRFRAILSQVPDAPCCGPGRTPLNGEPQSDVSWLQGPGSWPRRAGNAPNTLLPPIAKGREAPERGHFTMIARLNPLLWGDGKWWGRKYL